MREREREEVIKKEETDRDRGQPGTKETLAKTDMEIRTVQKNQLPKTQYEKKWHL